MVKKIVDKLKNDEEFIKERKVKNLIKVDDEIGRRLYEGISKN
jgi:catalase